MSDCQDSMTQQVPSTRSTRHTTHNIRQYSSDDTMPGIVWQQVTSTCSHSHHYPHHPSANTPQCHCRTPTATIWQYIASVGIQSWLLSIHRIVHTHCTQTSFSDRVADVSTHHASRGYATLAFKQLGVRWSAGHYSPVLLQESVTRSHTSRMKRNTTYVSSTPCHTRITVSTVIYRVFLVVYNTQLCTSSYPHMPTDSRQSPLTHTIYFISHIGCHIIQKEVPNTTQQWLSTDRNVDPPQPRSHLILLSFSHSSGTLFNRRSQIEIFFE